MSHNLFTMNHINKSFTDIAAKSQQNVDECKFKLTHYSRLSGLVL